MRVAVVGAGIIGVTTAYELASDGHEVVVFERRGSVAAESSFANAGLVALGRATPWCTPGLPRKLLASLFGASSLIQIRSGLEPRTLGWLWQCWRASRARSFEAHRGQMQRLADFSRECLHRITSELHLDYEHADGCMLLLRSANEVLAAQRDLALLKDLGQRVKWLDAAQCRSIEPGLNPKTALEAGIYLPDDEVGNCRQFAHLLRIAAQRLGVRFRFHTSVRRIHAGPTPQLVHLYAPPDTSALVAGRNDSMPPEAADTQPLPFEALTENFNAVVVCAAMGAPALLGPHGLHLPLQAVYGHSVTAPLRQGDMFPDQGPHSALIDEQFQVAISRLGARVRVSGGAEIGGSPEHHAGGAFDLLYKVLHDWFPGVARMSHAQRWKGARPMLPDGPPLLGASGIDGVWLNLGHGNSGWALACGSARLLADAVIGRGPSIEIEGLGLERLRR
jgi:D-amino-acid dehydrogenase